MRYHLRFVHRFAFLVICFLCNFASLHIPRIGPAITPCVYGFVLGIIVIVGVTFKLVDNPGAVILFCA
jgi:hypothetical protein